MATRLKPNTHRTKARSSTASKQRGSRLEKPEWEWRDAVGATFHARAWEPAGKPRAVLALVHGLGEHIGRYESLGRALARHHYVLAGFDLRGHGRSGGRRGHTPSYAALMDDIADFVGQLAARYPGRPLFLYGHSLGGNLVLNFVLRRRPDAMGAIVSSPWLRVAFEPPPFRILLARILNGIAPAISQEWGLESTSLSHELDVVEAYDADPLVHGRISVRMYVEASEAGRWAIEHAADFPIPLLLMHGTADEVTSVDASREFAHRGPAWITWHPWKDLYHEVHNEKSRQMVLKSILTWLEVQLRPRRRPRALLDKRSRP
jgi:alpha-beta hydrolase superfamily lysophospholipase